MAATTPLKHLPYIIEWMTQTDPPREASKVLKNEWLVGTPLFK